MTAVDVGAIVVDTASATSNWLLPNRVQNLAQVRVHHVGQGDSSSLIDDQGTVVCYIDYGGCAYHPDRNGNYVGTPLRLPPNDDPVVVLTHWDKDHFYSANFVPAILDRKWLVPRQRVSPQAAVFAAKLTDAHLWPEVIGSASVVFSAGPDSTITVQKTAAMPINPAAPEDRNHTGLSVVVERNHGKYSNVAVFAGDAPLDVAPLVGAIPANVDSVLLVAYHHGSNTDWTAATDASLNAIVGAPGLKHLIYSYGLNASGTNLYGHPFKASYAAIAWSSTEETPVVCQSPPASSNYSYPL